MNVTTVITREQLAEYRRTQDPRVLDAPVVAPVVTGPPQTEDEIHRDVAAWLKALGTRLRCIWFHPPLGGKRRRGEAARLHGMGAVAGVADLCFCWGLPVPGCGFIELKTADGKLSAAQLAFAKRCAVQGVPFEVARSLDEAQAIVRKWGVIQP